MALRTYYSELHWHQLPALNSGLNSYKLLSSPNFGRLEELEVNNKRAASQHDPFCSLIWFAALLINEETGYVVCGLI